MPVGFAGDYDRSRATWGLPPLRHAQHTLATDGLRGCNLCLLTTLAGSKRFDSDKSGDREVQRTMLELLSQLDGFNSDDNIKASHTATP